MSIVNAGQTIPENSEGLSTEPKLVWSQPDRSRSFADLPKGSAAFRTWLGSLVILGVVSALAAGSAEALGVSEAAILIIAGFLLAVAALNYPSSTGQRARLRIVK